MTQGWDFISEIFILFRGSTWSILEIRSFATGLTSLGILYAPSKIQGWFTFNFFVQKGDIILIKWEKFGKKGIKNNSTRPDINWCALILSLTDNLRSGIIGTPTKGFEHFSIFHLIRESKVTDFNNIILINQYILEF